MKNYEQFKRLIMFVIGIVIISLLVLTFAFVWYTQYNDSIIMPFVNRGNWLVIAIYLVLLVLFQRIYNGYKVGYLKRSDVIYSQTLSVLITNVITYFQVSLIGRGLVNPVPFFLMTLVDILLIILWTYGANAIYSKLYPPHKMIIVYGSDLADSLSFKMSRRADKYEIRNAISIEEGLEAIQKEILQYESVIICDVKAPERNRLLKFCFENSIRTYITPKLSDIIIRSADEIHLFDTPLLLCRNMGLSFEQRVIKRFMDIVLSVVFLLVASPFMVLTAIAIKAYDRGPVFFKQKRCTLNKKVFEIYKFRSMIVDAEKDGIAMPAVDHDPRITPIGRFIRKTRLDELPQLFNVLKGDMSIVGPRPERVEHVEAYSREIPEFSYRLKVKGGLTGYAQIMGKYNTSAYDKLKLDLMYIENYSLLLDLKLLFMTVKVMFMKDSTEGFHKQNITSNVDQGNAIEKNN